MVVPFKGIIRLLETELTAAGHSCAIVNGDVPMNKRSEIFPQFKTQKDPHVLLAIRQPRRTASISPRPTC